MGLNSLAGCCDCDWNCFDSVGGCCLEMDEKRETMDKKYIYIQQDKTNWRGILIFIVLASLFTGGILFYINQTTKETTSPTTTISAHNVLRNTVTIWDENENMLRLVILAPDLVRVRVGPNGDFPHDSDPEFVVVKSDTQWELCPFNVTENNNYIIVDTEVLQVEFSKKPLRLSIFGPDNQILLEQDASGFEFSSIQDSFVLNRDEHIYGFGGKRDHLDKRGRTIDIWNKAAWASTGDDSYQNVPFYLSTRGYGLYLHNWWRSEFDIGNSASDRIKIKADGGELDFYFFYGPSFKDILNRYTELTGRPSLQPLWMFGFQQAAHSYDEIAAAAQELRARNLPCDVLYVNHHRENKKVISKEFIAWLESQGYRLSAGLGMPFVYKKWPHWEKFKQRGHLVVDENGNTPVYHTIYYDGTHIDFFSDDAADYVFDFFCKEPLENGVKGSMYDFGELKDAPDNIYFTGAGNRSVTELHNVYGLKYAEQLINRMAAYTGDRKWGLFRAGFAGSQRFGWTWTADSLPNWKHFLPHLRGVLCLGFGGFAYTGYDIGGFAGVCTDELYARWFQAGMFNSVAWAHGSGDHEPYSHGSLVEDICRESIKLRYKLIPYIYTLNWESSQIGVPIMRAMVLEFQNDEKCYTIDDQFLFGPSLLVAPVLEQGATNRDIYLPAGQWIDYSDGKTKFNGPITLFSYDAPLEKIPLFVKGGAIIPMGPVMQYTNEKPLNPLTLDVYPYGSSSFTLYEDDGESLDFKNGSWITTNYECNENGDNITITINERVSGGGSYTPNPRDYMLKVHNRPDTVSTVMMNGKILTKCSLSQLESGNTGWSHDVINDFIQVRFKDTGNDITIDILVQ